MHNPNWGVIGLGVMGTSLSRNLAQKGVPLALYNRRVEGVEENVAEKHCLTFPELKSALPFEDLNRFVDSLQAPRKIILMLPAGKATNSILKHLTPLLRLLAFTLSIDDLIIASFVSGPGSNTLPMLIYSRVKVGLRPDINALATIMIVMVSIGVLLACWLMIRQKHLLERDANTK